MDWRSELKALEDALTELKERYRQAVDPDILEEVRVKFLGKKGPIKALLTFIKNAPPNEKRELGQAVNRIKKAFESWIREKRYLLSEKEEEVKDPTLPARDIELGHRHIINQTIIEIVDIFKGMGFALSDGPEIEQEYYNFSALNIDITHPSRDAFDTFYLNLPPDKEKGKYLLRSHTSPMQVRIMERFSPPVAVVVPGRVYRPDAVDASHSFMFHQIEGFLVDTGVRFSHLKGILMEFAREYFYDEIQLRFRPHYFPFTEPSAEVDISCLFCKGEGCSVCRYSGWIEVLGCGMIHPKVLFAVGEKYIGKTGFAFGMGVERLCMLKYRIPDIRLFYSADVRFLRQF